MISAILDHLWQSTLLALGIALLALVFRTARASVRYGLWFAASLKFLVPFALLGALGRLLAPAMRPPAEVTPGAVFIEQTTQPFSQSFAAAPAAHASAPVAYGAHGASGFDPTLILLAVWALGCVTVLMVWMVRWAKIRSAVRSAIPLAWPAPMPVLASSWMREPGLVGLWRPVLVIPESLPEHLSQPELEALVAHEACHLRRRDNLSAAVHMLVEAVFWFHPMVWWIGSRLIAEREHACDEVVVRSGHNRATYARTLVECCRLYLQSPLSCVAGAAGSNLKRRVVMIMTAPVASALSLSRKSLLAAIGLCALATPVAAGWLTSPEGAKVTAHVEALVSKAAAVPHELDAARRPLAALGQPDPPTVIAVGQNTPVPAAASSANPDAASAPDAASPALADVSVSLAVNDAPQKVSLIPVASREPPPGAFGSEADVAPVQASGSLISEPVWVRLPTRQAIAEAYPIGADRQGVPGRATMRCHADGRGYLSSCVPIAEHPAGFGFGKAAAFLETSYKLRTLDGAGVPVQGRLVDVSLEFTPRYWAKIADPGGSRDASSAPQVVRWLTDPYTHPYGSERYPWEAIPHGVADNVTLD
ncbi:MAG TPA: M56 family metallopeptidase, partial [Caulobacteraceae bacterium]|nr:M56 family metallopeptidase [Caulobacteraceae bacterium]